jgi:hypothetical protein
MDSDELIVRLEESEGVDDCDADVLVCDSLEVLTTDALADDDRDNESVLERLGLAVECDAVQLLVARSVADMDAEPVPSIGAEQPMEPYNAAGGRRHSQAQVEGDVQLADNVFAAKQCVVALQASHSSLRLMFKYMEGIVAELYDATTTPLMELHCTSKTHESEPTPETTPLEEMDALLASVLRANEKVD